MAGEAAPSRSIFGVDPLDDFATTVGDWIWHHCEGVPDIEVCCWMAIVLTQQIEAKLGVLIDRNSNERIRLPILSEASAFLERSGGAND